ncbi:MAG: F-box/LRR-repeat protein 14 [Planctomycetaceae bacterium]|nr:F-box/LRR-repeat protein 14 [Planctomycetaceae bacterium]
MLQKRLLIGAAILLLLVFITLALGVMAGEQRTEQMRREIVKAGGKSTTDRQVLPWLQPLIGPQAHSPLDQTVIVQLMLNNPRIGDTELQRLHGLTGVRLVDLGDSRVTNGGMQHLQAMQQLEVLYLNHTEITQLDALKPLRALKYLKLDFSKVPESNLACLDQFPELRRVSLAGLKITEAGTKLLAKCRQLESLNLEVANLGDHGLVPLQSLTKLKFLSLKDATFSPADLQAFQQAAPDCKIGQ